MNFYTFLFSFDNLDFIIFEGFSLGSYIITVVILPEFIDLFTVIKCSLFFACSASCLNMNRARKIEKKSQAGICSKQIYAVYLNKNLEQ